MALAMEAGMQVGIFERRGRRLRADRRVGAGCALLAAAVIGLPAVALAATGWRPAPWAGGRTEPQIAVAGTAGQGWAVATGGSVWWHREDAGGAVERSVLEDVRDLAFGPSASLWIGTGSGLFRWEPGGRPRRRALRGDAGAAEIRRIVGSGAGLLVATGAGAYWSTKGRILPSTPRAWIPRLPPSPGRSWWCRS